MLKIFSTQLTGILNKIQKEEEETIEEAGRVLAQTVLAKGHIYFAGFDEMEALCTEGVNGIEAFTNAHLLKDTALDAITSVDTVILAARFNDDPKANELVHSLKKETGVNIIAFSAVASTENGDLTSSADVHIDIKADRAIVPLDNGSKTGYPASIALLFAYQALQLTARDILMEYEDEFTEY